VAVHPHACGDDNSMNSGNASHAGSPPRVWGRPRKRGRTSRASRFTPTRVGTTCSIPTCRRRREVHPHACGDDMSIARRHTSRVRFTPTRVGTTKHCLSRFLPSSVHPHACGDDKRKAVKKSLDSGSPPRVWGRRREYQAPRANPRFTPTRVGTTKRRVMPNISSTVHPHACGDDGRAGRRGAG